MARVPKSVWRRLRAPLRGHGFEAATAVGWAFVGVAYIVGDDRVAVHSPVAHPVHPLEAAWAAMYMAGGVGALVGLYAARTELRVAGLVMLAGGLVMEGSAAAYYDPDPRVVLYGIYAVACLMRAAVVVQSRRRRRRGGR